MAKPKAKLGSRWASESDVQDRLAKARTGRAAQQRMLGTLSDKIDRRAEEVERSLSDVPKTHRLPVVTKALSGFRGELRRDSADQRKAYVRQAAEHAEWMRSVETH